MIWTHSFLYALPKTVRWFVISFVLPWWLVMLKIFSYTRGAIICKTFWKEDCSFLNQFHFTFEVYEFLRYFGNWTFIKYLICKYFLPSKMLCFYLCWLFPLLCNTFKLDIIMIVDFCGIFGVHFWCHVKNYSQKQSSPLFYRIFIISAVIIKSNSFQVNFCIW